MTDDSRATERTSRLTVADVTRLDATWLDESSEPTDEQPKVGGQRYLDLGLIGVGGMGEVRRVRDRALDRVLAMKIIRREYAENPSVVARFLAEAQATAQLEHPGIVPVHDFGRLDDGRLFFVMRKVVGQTFGEVVGAVHAASRNGAWEAAPSGWTLHRLIEAMRKICEAVAYAHARGVVHRDLKPDNVMVGGFGELLVVDWGLAKVVGAPDSPLPPVVTSRSRSDAWTTRVGTIAGTPAYMAPEQAAGDNDRVGPAADVYALGVMLHEVLLGRPGETMPADLPVPDALRDIADRARQPRPEDRFADAAAMAAELAAWLDGARRREQALELVAQAEAVLPELERLRARASSCRGAAGALLDEIPPHAPLEAKRPAWALQDEATALDRQIELRQVEAHQLLRAALSQVPDLAEAHDLLASAYRGRHADAEERRDVAAAARYEALLRAHDTGRHAAWLHGNGRLALVTDPPDAEVFLHRYEPLDRHLVAVPVRGLGRAPLGEIDLPMGSYLLEIRAPGREVVRYPVQIARCARWDGVPPGATEPLAIELPPIGALGAGEVYVPAGWCIVGGDDDAIGALPRRRVWVDAFAIGRFPVSHGEYLAFLHDLLGRDEAEALRRVPRALSPVGGDLGVPAYDRVPGGFALRDHRPGEPVTGIDWFDARAYAAWLAERTGQPWRLPGDVEWEKAARGVDGRFFPWGDHLDATFCCFMSSHAGHPSCPDVDAWPIDESPYGVRGLGGGVRDWCATAYARQGAPLVGGRMDDGADDDRPDPPRVVRGGCWSHHDRLVRAATRWWETPTARAGWYGFRVARSWR